MLTVVQYNPMSLVQAGRTHDLAEHMSMADIIALSGTRLRLAAGETVAVSQVGPFDH